MLQKIVISDYKVREFTCQTDRRASRATLLPTGTIVNKDCIEMNYSCYRCLVIASDWSRCFKG